MSRGNDNRQFALVTGLIGGGHAMSHFYMLCLPPLFPLLADQFGLSHASLGLMMTTFGIATAIAQVPSGVLVDRLGALGVLIGGLLGLGLGMGLIGLAPAYVVILGLAVVAGLSNGVFHPAGYTILTASIAPGRLGKAFSIHQVGGSVGFIVAPVVMIALSTTIGWRPALVIAGSLAIVHSALLLHYRSHLHSRAPAESGDAAAAPEGPPPFRDLFRIPGLVPLFAAFVGGAFLNLGLQSFMITVLTGYHGLSLTDAAPCLTIFLAAAAGGSLVGGVVSDRTTRHARMAGGAMLVSGVALALLSGARTPLWVLMGGFAVVGAFLGLMRTPRDLMVRAVAPPGAVGRTFSLFSIGISVGGATSPLLVGMMIDVGLTNWVFAMLAGVFVISAVMALLADRARRRGAAGVSDAVPG